MVRIIFCTLLLFSFFFSSSQPAYLFVKKGYRKKLVYTEGDRILLQLREGTIYNGLITRLENDTIFMGGRPVPVADVRTVLLPRDPRKAFHLSGSNALLIAGGTALVVTGITASKQASFRQALAAGLTIGGTPLLLQFLRSRISFRRTRYPIGRKFRLQVLDFHLPRQRPF